MRDETSLAAAVQHLHFAASDLTWAAVSDTAIQQELKIASALKQMQNAMQEITNSNVEARNGVS